jgi:hypothetical protein
MSKIVEANITMAIENLKTQIDEIRKLPEYRNAKSMMVSALMYFISAKKHLSARNKDEANRCVRIAIGLTIMADKKIKEKTRALANS